MTDYRYNSKQYRLDQARRRLIAARVVSGECWRFGGYHDRYGYGRMFFDGRDQLVHRVAACVFLGLRLSDWRTGANHRRECRFKDCWKPEHLYLGSQHDNLVDHFVVKNAKKSQ